jgi:polyisoprenyl-phosphate glycosyltransferase
MEPALLPPAPAANTVHLPRVAIVSPVYNESENLRELLTRLDEVCTGLPYTFELWLINDGSNEETTALLDALAAQRRDLVVLHLSRNFGHQAALSAGLEEAYRSGVDGALMLDSDLQHPPSLIPELLSQWRAGYDVVYTIRDDQVRTSAFKRITARLFYRLIGWVSETTITPGSADFRLLDRRALEALISLPERGRFLRGLTSWIGFRQVGVHYVPQARFAGGSKYDLKRMYRLGIDGLVSMTTLPLRAILAVGLCISLLSLTYLVYVIGAHFLTNRTIPGWSSVIVAVLLLGGINLTVLGVMGLYMAKIYDEVKGRPLFLVRARVGAHRARASERAR